jgi:hypothetical protein
VLFAARLSMGLAAYYFAELGVRKETFIKILGQETVMMAPFLFLSTALYLN